MVLAEDDDLVFKLKFSHTEQSAAGKQMSGRGCDL
jgi:hypothetical protein